MTATISPALPLHLLSRAEAPAKIVRAPVGPVIYQAIVDLGNSNQIATRQGLVEATGLSYTLIDDAVKRLVDDGRVRRVVNGVFEAVPPAPEERAVSVTHLPGGGCKLEIGDFCADLSMRELRMIAMATAGVSLQFGR